MAGLAFLLLLASAVLGATVFNQVAGASGNGKAKRAAPPPDHVIVDNTPLAVSGTVQLAANASVETTAADNPAFQPVTASQGSTEGGGDELTVDVYTVPAGSRLVIEQVSFLAVVQPTDVLQFAYLEAAPSQATHFLNVTHRGGVVVTGSTLTRLYADPETTVSCVFSRTTGIGTWSSTCSISGYLVDL
jgi:hypothetical protein